MKLAEYFKKMGLQKIPFAKRVGISDSTLFSILREERDVMLSVAIRIEKETHGAVKCIDLLPKHFQMK
jgi:plasmid maintenance system antidote protein VapI